MADKTLRPGSYVEVEGFIPYGCKRFNVNLGKDSRNLVIHFDVRFDYLEDRSKIVMNSMKDGVFAEEQRESFFPFQEGSDTKLCFTFEHTKITVRLPAGRPVSFPLRFPIVQLLYVSVDELQLKSIIIK
ncbi:galectin-1-like isoform X2 [Aquarana catesbeiana]|uniref:galectin-1-like isoform X2 n=1 Tax=Aquarana catesbeiana TaxID=8400 RepID=UPI003CCA5998